MKFGLSDASIQKIHDVFKHYPQVEKVVLYGSRARGDYENGSDIDLTLHGGETLTHFIVSKIATDLDGQLLPYTIDLSILSHIRNPELVEQINRNGVVFYIRQT